MRTLVFWGGILALAGCTESNPLFCEKHSDCASGVCTNNRCEVPDAGPPDARVRCDSDEQCEGVCDESQGLCVPCQSDAECMARAGGVPVCSSDGRCVECELSDHCDLGTPICEANQCRACGDHAECEGRGDVGDIGYCRAGACLGDDAVYFVDDDGTDCGNATGSRAAPFCEVQDAISERSDNTAAGDPDVIVLLPGRYDPVVIDDLSLVLTGTPGAEIRGGDTGVDRVRVDGSQAVVEIRRLAVSGGTTFPAAGIYCRNGATCTISRVSSRFNFRGIFAEATKMLTVERSLVANNTGGGIRTDNTDFRIENNLIYTNGAFNSSAGGARLGASGSAMNPTRIFRHNTVVGNFADVGMSGVGGGVSCLVNTDVVSSILWDNTTPEASPGTCRVRYSIINDPVVGGMNNNKTSDPMLVDPVGSEDFHIRPDSPAVNAGDPTGGPPAVDHFGQLRSDGTPDIGADEQGAP